MDWQASLREPLVHLEGYPMRTFMSMSGLSGLTALNLSYNAFTDFLPEELGVVLRMGAPLYGKQVHSSTVKLIHFFFILEIPFNSTKVLVQSWLFCIQYFPCSVSFLCMHGVGAEV
jgi:hypothetical protein